ncbi:MAG: hypothetical protein Q8M18_19425 [Bradyrhizobium sp.]|nr:hypothetical protein [Bradyrhizobium sp.]
MKAVVLAATLLTLLGGTAHAKLAPYEPGRSALADFAAPAQPLAAVRESHYFNAPPAPRAAGQVRCRTHISLFDKMELAQWC